MENDFSSMKFLSISNKTEENQNHPKMLDTEPKTLNQMQHKISQIL